MWTFDANETMCWNATTSFATLALGTVANVVCAYILRGTDTMVYILAWQYALLMQLPEGIAWIQLNRNAEADVRIASRLAMVLNVTQPVALYATVRWNGRGMRYGHVVLLLYAVVLATHAEYIWDHSSSIAPEIGCAHLDLRYWSSQTGIVYVVAVLLLGSEIDVYAIRVVNISLVLVSLVIALAFYTCGVGSIWCWLTVVSGPVLVATHHTFVTPCWSPRASHRIDENRFAPAIVVRDRRRAPTV